MAFDEEETEIIREFLTVFACGYERETFDFHCCDAAELIRKIDNSESPKVTGE